MRDPVECGTKRCPHCHVVTRDDRGHVDRVTDRIRPLSADDLRWWLREAESCLGVKSTYGAFVDLAMSGIQSGGRSNGVERSWTDRKRAAAARERCIRHRLRLLEASPSVLAVLSAAYGPHAFGHRAEQVTGLVDARRDLEAIFGELLPVVLLTDAAGPLFEPGTPPPARTAPSEVRGRVRCGGVVREEHRKDFAAGEGSVVTERPQAEMVFDSVLRVDGPVETLHAMETPESFYTRVQTGDATTTRGEVHIRRWRGYGDGAGVLARLFGIAHSARRAKTGDKSKLTPEQIALDAANLKTVTTMKDEARALREHANASVGIVGVDLAGAPQKPPKGKRRSANRSRSVEAPHG